MSEQDSIVEEQTGGFDRRAALKKAAIAGGIVWAAPMIASTKASAAAVCTLDCAPTAASADITITGTKGPCIPGGPPGSQRRTFGINSVTIDSGAVCPCTGTATVTYSPEVIVYDDPDPNQGIRTVQIGTLTVTVTCTDEQGRSVARVCDASVIATFSGSCEGVGNTGFAVGELSNCFATCVDAPA